MSSIQIIYDYRTKPEGKGRGKGYIFHICDSRVADLEYTGPAGSSAGNAVPIATSNPYPTLKQCEKAAHTLAESILDPDLADKRGVTYSKSPALTRDTSPASKSAKKHIVSPTSADQLMKSARTNALNAERLGKPNGTDRPYGLAHLLSVCHERTHPTLRSRMANDPAEQRANHPLHRMFELRADMSDTYQSPHAFWLYEPRIFWRTLPVSFFERHTPDPVLRTQSPEARAAWHNATRAGKEAVLIKTDSLGRLTNAPRTGVLHVHEHYYRLPMRPLVWWLYTGQLVPTVHMHKGYSDWRPENIHLGPRRPKHWD